MDKADKAGEKRTAGDHQDVLSGVKALLIEADGTISPSSFAKEKLGGYVKENIKEYLTSKFADKEVQDLIEGLRKQASETETRADDAVVAIPGADAEQDAVVKGVVDSVTGQLSKGNMTKPLGKLMSSILKDGCKKKALTGELFEDVVPALKELTEQGGTRAYVFSSQCLDLQRLLYGDLSELITDYFGPSAGPRTDKDTYVKLAEGLELAPSDVMYLTHQSTEATAAHAAGMKTALVVRPGNQKLSDKDLETFLTISSFAELVGEDGTAAAVPQKKKVCHEQPSPKKATSQPTTHATKA